MDTVELAYQSGILAARELSRAEQKLLGQFMTPPAIARLMASRACANLVATDSIRILEPAAGSGVLAVAAVERLLESGERPQRIEIEMYEVDERLKSSLTRAAETMRRDCRRAGVSISVLIKMEDFLLSAAGRDEPQFDLVIANPPYFKIGKQDKRAVRHAYAVHGQPNIYGLFMAACSRVLRSNGRWCFITPRSWTNGQYFARARRYVLTRLRLDAIHIFESRQEHFAEDEILQEAMITWATCQAQTDHNVALSSSSGISDLTSSTVKMLPVSYVVSEDSYRTVSLPSQEAPHLDQFTNTLTSYGLKVSTGPVVAFRATSSLREAKSRSTVPLLWMQHIQHMRVCWPINKKREYICANAETAWMLVPNENMVVLRRFSPKEDIRRITAAPYLAGSISAELIGLENHTNYIYRPGSKMTAAETKGLAAYLNSEFVDTYLRSVSGSTQVNASDLRSLPLPAHEVLIAIGKQLPQYTTLRHADAVIDRVFGSHREAVFA